MLRCWRGNWTRFGLCSCQLSEDLGVGVGDSEEDCEEDCVGTLIVACCAAVCTAGWDGAVCYGDGDCGCVLC